MYVYMFCSQSSGNKDINLSRCKFDSQQINFSLQDALRYGTWLFWDKLTSDELSAINKLVFFNRFINCSCQKQWRWMMHSFVHTNGVSFWDNKIFIMQTSFYNS